MRERAEGAAPGPWSMRDGWGPADDGLMRCVRIASDADESTVLESEGAFRGYELAASQATFEHIASLHPSVALAVASYLEIEASIAERNLPDESGSIHRALAVARAYLGSAEQ
jgi:hypothetical protein